MLVWSSRSLPRPDAPPQADFPAAPPKLLLLGWEFGQELVGQGTVWLNNVKVEIVGSDVPTSKPSLSI
jgi:hypothetical protein